MPFELPAYRFCLERLELLGDAAGSPNGELVSFDGTMEWVKQTLWGSLNASQLFTFFVGPKFWMFRVVTNLKSIRSWKFMFRMYKSMIFTNKNIPVLYWRCILDWCEFCSSPRPFWRRWNSWLQCTVVPACHGPARESCPAVPSFLRPTSGWDMLAPQRMRKCVYTNTICTLLCTWMICVRDLLSNVCNTPPWNYGNLLCQMETGIVSQPNLSNTEKKYIYI